MKGGVSKHAAVTHSLTPLSGTLPPCFQVQCMVRAHRDKVLCLLEPSSLLSSSPHVGLDHIGVVLGQGRWGFTDIEPRIISKHPLLKKVYKKPAFLVLRFTEKKCLDAEAASTGFHSLIKM